MVWSVQFRSRPTRGAIRIHRLGSAPGKDKAGKRLTAATVKGELVIHVVAKPQARSKKRALTPVPPREIERVVVPVNVLKRLMTTSRGSLPDHPIRPSIRTAEGNEKLFALLTVGLLVVRESAFNAWYRTDRAKGKWPSQRSKSKIGDGRPTKQTETRGTRFWRWYAMAPGAPRPASRSCILYSSPLAVPACPVLIRLHAGSTSCTARRAKRDFFGSRAGDASGLGRELHYRKTSLRIPRGTRSARISQVPICNSFLTGSQLLLRGQSSQGRFPRLRI